MKKPTLADVAEKAGVSKPTVSRYLREENVKPEIGEKIQAAIHELGYVPKSYKPNDDMENHLDLNLPENEKEKITMEQIKNTKTKGYRFAVLTKSYENYESNRLIHTLQRAFYERGCLLETGETQGIEEIEKQYMTWFVQQKVDAILVESCSSPEYIIRHMRITDVPVIFLRQPSNGYDVYLNEVEAGQLLGQYLLDKKHVMIRYLGVEEELTQYHIKGIKTAYHALKQPVDLIGHTSSSAYEQLYEQIKELFAEKIDLLILQNDEIAVAVHKFLNDYHIAVPQNVSLISFGGSDKARIVSPEMTTITYDYPLFAKYICEFVHALLTRAPYPKRPASFFQIEERDSVR